MSDESTITVQAVEGSIEWCNRIRDRLRRLVFERDTGFMEIGEMLHKLCDLPLDNDPTKPPVYSLWGYSSLWEMAEKELSIGRRTAERYRRIWQFLVNDLEGKLPIGLRHRYAALGFAKAHDLVATMNLENAEAWIKMAEDLSYSDLRQLIRDRLREQRQVERDAEVKAAEDEALGVEEEQLPKQKPAPPPLPEDIAHFRQKSFFLSPEQFDLVELTLKCAAKLSRSGKAGHNITMVCTDFLATNNFQLPGIADSDMYLNYLAKIERLFGKRLVVIDPKAKQIEYGVEALKMLAGVAS